MAQGGGWLGGVLADPVLAGVHQRGDLGDVGAAFGVGDRGDLRGPRPGRERDEGAEAVAEAGVEDGGDVAGAGQVPFGDRVGEDAGRGPGRRVRRRAGCATAIWPGGRVGAVAGRQGVHEQVVVALVAGRGGLGGPDRVQEGQVVGVGQGLVAGLGGGVLLAVAVQHVGQHGERLVPCGGWRERGGRLRSARRS